MMIRDKERRVTVTLVILLSVLSTQIGILNLYLPMKSWYDWMAERALIPRAADGSDGS